MQPKAKYGCMNLPSSRRGGLQEKELIQLARRGDNPAWAELVRLHQQAVFRLAYLHLGDAAEAEDAAQDCLIRAFRSLRSFDEDRPLRPWLLRIVSNLALNRRRSAARYLAALQRAVRDEPITTDSPVGGTETKQHSEELWKAMQKLPGKMQNVLYLRYFLELTIEETAQALEIAEGTVKSQTHRALERLQTIIRTEFPALQEGRE
jgi:RNA polymerase sigma factor (sigma-70 family)